MAKKTNTKKGNTEYYRIRRKVGRRLNKDGQWVDWYKDFYGSGKSEAEAKYDTFMESLTSGTDQSGRCLGEVIDEWIDTTFIKSNLAGSTIRKYKEAYQNNLQPDPLAGKPISEVTAADLQAWLNDHPATYGAKRSTFNLLRRFYKYADLNNICRDITSSVVLQKPKNEDLSDFNSIDVWQDDELKKLYSALENHRLRLLVILAVNTGARFSELLALTYDDISADGLLRINKQVTESSGRVRLSTTKSACSNRVIPLPDPIIKEVAKHREWHTMEMQACKYKTNNIFTTSGGKYYYRRSITHALERVYNKNGIPHHKFHAFRHTFGTNLSRIGVPIEETSALMGHSSISVTAKYYIDISAKRKQKSLEKLASLTFPEH